MQVAINNRSNTTGKNVFKAIFLILVWLVILSLAKDAIHLQKGFGRVEESKLRLEEQENRNNELKIKFEAVRTDEYREKLIRDQLNMQKEGEVVAVLPNRAELGFVPSTDKDNEEVNWKKWLFLLQ